MKSLYVLLFLIFMLPFVCRAQGRLRNSHYLETHAGFSAIGLYGSVYYSVLFNRTVVGKAGGSFTYGRHYELAFRRMYADVLGAFKLHEYRRTILTNALFGMSLNGDYPGFIQSDQLERQFFVDYGLLAGLESELRLSRQAVLLVTGNYRYYLEGRFSHWQYQLGMGLKFML